MAGVISVVTGDVFECLFSVAFGVVVDVIVGLLLKLTISSTVGDEPVLDIAVDFFIVIVAERVFDEIDPKVLGVESESVLIVAVVSLGFTECWTVLDDCVLDVTCDESERVRYDTTFKVVGSVVAVPVFVIVTESGKIFEVLTKPCVISVEGLSISLGDLVDTVVETIFDGLFWLVIEDVSKNELYLALVIVTKELAETSVGCVVSAENGDIVESVLNIEL